MDIKLSFGKHWIELQTDSEYAVTLDFSGSLPVRFVKCFEKENRNIFFSIEFGDSYLNF